MHRSASSRVRAVGIGACIALAATACAASSGAATPSGAAAPASTPALVQPSLVASASAPASAAPEASVPTAEVIQPSAVIDLPDATGVIPMATDGTTLWAAENGAIVRIDGPTGAVSRLKAPVASDDTTLAIADDGLWATRWAGGKLYRLDPTTGEVLLDVDMPSAVRIAFVGEDLWVGREDTGVMTRVDRKTGATGPTVSQGAYGTAAMGDLWFGSGGTSTVLRVDPSTGETVATIDAPGESNCGIGGTFPDNAWTGCFGREVQPRSAARVDPATNAVATVATIPPSHGGGVVVIDGVPWFLGTFEQPDGSPSAGLLRLDPATGAIERFLSIPGADPDQGVVAGDALWIADEAGHRILRVDTDQLSR